MLLGDTHRLIVFRHAARLGSFSGAAAALSISQPAVSRHIAALEDRVQAVLFTRNAGGAQLTEAGRVLADAIDDAFGALAEGLESIRGQSNQLRLAVQPAIAESWLAPRLTELRTAMAPTVLHITIFDRTADLSASDHDVSIQFDPRLGPNEQSAPLVTESVFPIASPELAEREGLSPSTDPARLQRDIPLLRADDRDRTWISWGDWFAGNGIAWSPRSDDLVYPTYSILVQQALAGRGVALGWSTLLGDLVERRMLVPVGPVVTRPDKAYHLVWASGLSRHDGVRRLRRWLLEMVAAELDPT